MAVDLRLQSELKVETANGYLEIFTTSFCKSASVSFLFIRKPGIVHNMFADTLFEVCHKQVEHDFCVLLYWGYSISFLSPFC